LLKQSMIIFMKKVCVPHSFQIVIDDVGWRCGKDTRYKGGPSRSGIEHRRHTANDYRAIVELGKRIGMRIKCAFVIGEWDRTNLLRDVPYATEYFDEWDNASRIDKNIDEFAQIISDNQDYFEIAMHGCLHEYWTGKHSGMQPEFYGRNINGEKRVMLEADAVKRHIEAFFALLEQNNLPTNIRSFVPPNFSYKFSRGDGELSYILKDYGIKYISTPYSSMVIENDYVPETAAVENGIITVNRTNDFTRWETIDAPIPGKIKRSYYGMHWPNILHSDSDRNMEVVDKWVKYFEQYKDDFEIFFAGENGRASSQALYKIYTKTVVKPDSITLNFENVDKQGAVGLYPEIYLNFTKDCKPVCDNGGELSLFYERENFNCYKLTRLEPKLSKLEVRF